MHTKSSATANEYLCAIERNQNGKYNVRVRAVFAPGAMDSGNGREASGHRSGWMLPVYFLASSFNAAMKKLEEALQLLQKERSTAPFLGGRTHRRPESRRGYAEGIRTRPRPPP